MAIIDVALKPFKMIMIVYVRIYCLLSHFFKISRHNGKQGG